MVCGARAVTHLRSSDAREQVGSLQRGPNSTLTALGYGGRKRLVAQQAVADSQPRSFQRVKVAGDRQFPGTTRKRQHTLAMTGWNMKKLSIYRRSTGLVMALVMGVHLFGGSGLFCTNESLRFLRAAGIDPAAIGLNSSDRGKVSDSAWNAAGNQGGNSNCCCKKHKKCPAIPRAAVTSNPTHRVHEIQSQAKSVRHYSVVAWADDHCFAAGADKPLTELARCAPFSCSDPLSLTSVLLI